MFKNERFFDLYSNFYHKRSNKVTPVLFLSILTIPIIEISITIITVWTLYVIACFFLDTAFTKENNNRSIKMTLNNLQFRTQKSEADYKIQLLRHKINKI